MAGLGLGVDLAVVAGTPRRQTTNVGEDDLVTNLRGETINAIAASGHHPDDIAFIGSRDSGHSCTWQEFFVLADFEYDNGFGSPEIATDLEVMFDDGSTMWRHEYDGSEAWMYSPPFVAPAVRHQIRNLGGPGTMWENLAALNAAVKETS